MKKVIIGISGGVDSAVAAALLKKQGYDVIGITFIFTDNFDTTDAINICKKLEIKHVIEDYKDVFKTNVIDKFINSYNKGITPNPCILCNREVKINFLYQNMIKYNCDYMATGHYAKISNGKLYKSQDLNKDQTYFLSQLSKEKLNHLILPLESVNKEEVRKIAKDLGFENFEKKDSQDVCFITGSFDDFINKNANIKEGSIINIKGNKIIGKHNGLQKYTIGQRKGLNIGGYQKRLFVVGKDIINNNLYVAEGDDNEYLYSDSCLLENINWLSDKKMDKCKAKFRYRQNENEVYIEFLDDNVIVKYPQKIKAITPGQACVFYNNDECLGSGIIKEVYKDNSKIWYL